MSRHHHNHHKKHSCKRDHIKWSNCADYIVVVLGTAGAALTRRLTDAGKKVLVLEAGPNLSDDANVLTPSNNPQFIQAFAELIFNQKYAKTSYVLDIPNSTVALNFQQSSHGQMWGGDSAHNAQQAVRGDATIYDEWAVEVGEPLGTGLWSYNGMLPYFKKLEKFNVLPTNPFGQSSNIVIDTNQRGTNGPVQFTQDYVMPNANPPFLPPQLPPVLDTFFNIAGPYTGSVVATTGAPGNFMVSGDDYNLPQNKLGAFIQQRTVTDELDPSLRTRCFSTSAYMTPDVVTPEGKGVDNRLTILSNAVVAKVIFKGDKCIGVLYIIDGVSHYARAKKEVILCAGAIETCAILQRSGVGDADVLRDAHVDLVYANPNVGRNLVQHYGAFARISCPFGIPLAGIGFNTSQMFLDGTKSPNYGAGFTEGQRKFQIFVLNLSTVALADSLAQLEAPETIDSSHPYAITDGNFLNGQTGLNFLDFMCWNLLPKSKGSALINTGNPFQMPTLDYGFFSDSDELRNGSTSDLTASAAMVDIVNAIAEDFTALVPGSNVVMTNPSPKNIVGNGAPANDPANVQQNTVAKDTIKAQSVTPFSVPWHPTGTCRMSDSPATGVVDKKLRVFGCRRLRCADNSVIPIIPSGNTQNVAYAIGEICADLILQ
jgi:choline dehydrogenase